MRNQRVFQTGAALALVAGLLTVGLSQPASAVDDTLATGVSVAEETPTPTPSVTPSDDGSGSWEDVPGDPDEGIADPVADLPKNPDGSLPQFSPPPDDPDCNSRSCLITLAKYEVTNSTHNREKGPSNCNFYSGWWGNSGDLGSCSTYNGLRWRTNNWCSDFSRWIWKNSGAVVSGIDPWAGSFYRANRSNGHYHSKGSGYTPVQGDAVLYDWDGTPSLGNDGWDIDHVGIFVKKSGSNIVVIEGNATKSGSRDGVYQKTRTTADVVGYVSPRF